jgi:hypothetical protein
MPGFYKGTIILGLPTGGESQWILSPFGRKMKVEDIQQVREERTASGKLVRDIISTKKKITLSWTEMDGADLDNLLTIYGYQAELIFYDYYLNDLANSYTVLMDPISRERLLLADDEGYDTGLWANIEVVLNEV